MDGKASPQRDNALKHGIFRSKLTAEDQSYAEKVSNEVLAMIGGDEKFKPICTVFGMRMSYLRMIDRYNERTYDPDSNELPPAIKVVGSFLEGARRDLAELGLTPASVSRVKADSDQISAQTVLDSIKGKSSE